jgi:hypothetical protein
MKWLASLIEENQGQTVIYWMHQFASASGLRTQTVAEYIKTLIMMHAVQRKGDKLFVQA